MSKVLALTRCTKFLRKGWIIIMKKIIAICFTVLLIATCLMSVCYAATFALTTQQQSNYSGEVIGYEKYISAGNDRTSKYNVLAEAKWKGALGWHQDSHFDLAPNQVQYRVKTSVQETDTRWRMYLTSRGTQGCTAWGEIIYD